MQHLTLEEILAIDEGKESPEALCHLEQCSVCQGKRRGLGELRSQLRALPLRTPREDQWPAVRWRIVAARRQRALAMGGCLAVAVLAFALAAPALIQKKHS